MQTLGPTAALKLDLMFDGIRYTESLGAAAAHAYPNYYPYRFQTGEPDPTGRGKVEIPYLITLPDETLIRVKGNFDSPWHVSGDRAAGFTPGHDLKDSDQNQRAKKRRETRLKNRVGRIQVLFHASQTVVTFSFGVVVPGPKRLEGIKPRAALGFPLGAPQKAHFTKT